MASKRYGHPRPSGEPSTATERKIRILLELIRHRSVRLSTLCAEYDASERSMLRDFQELRKIGARAGFRLSEKAEHDVIKLTNFESRPASIDQSARALQGLMRAAARALGKPVEEQLAPPEEEERRTDRRFLRFLMPTLREGTRVADVCKTLETAWDANARVRFKYKKRGERRVEPYAVIQRSGRYYLLGRDLDAKDEGWRYFALDEITGTISRVGTFAPREIPSQYETEDAIGWISSGKRIDVDVWLSPQIASSATSRVWQKGQRVVQHADGSASITLQVSDINEVVRWSLGFAGDAKIVAPHEAVDRARETIAQIASAYSPK